MNSEYLIRPVYSFLENGEELISNMTKEPSSNLIVNGNGFFVNDYFITSAHVIAESEGINGQSDPFIIWNGKRIILAREKALIWKDLPTKEDCTHYGYENKNLGDVAVFKVEGTNSPLMLSEATPKEGQILNNAFYHQLPQKSENSSSIQPIVYSGRNIYLWETTAKVHGIEDRSGNFFSATMNPPHPTGGGSSGSPLIEGNTVYGILYGSPTDYPEICVFYSTSHLLSLIRHLQ